MNYRQFDDIFEAILVGLLSFRKTLKSKFETKPSEISEPFLPDDEEPSEKSVEPEEPTKSDEELTKPVQTKSDEELDNEGYPWDERIHTKTRSLLSNGVWRLKRGAKPSHIKKIKAEWDTKRKQNAETSVWTFPFFMTAIIQHSISQSRISEACEACGITDGYDELSKDPKKIEKVADYLGLEK